MLQTRVTFLGRETAPIVSAVRFMYHDLRTRIQRKRLSKPHWPGSVAEREDKLGLKGHRGSGKIRTLMDFSFMEFIFHVPA